MSVGGFNQDAVAQAYLRAQAAMAGAQGPAPAAAQAPAYQAPAYANPYQPVAYQPVANPYQAPAQAPASGLGDALGRLYRYLTGQGQAPAAQPAAANPYQPIANPYQPIANPYQPIANPYQPIANPYQQPFTPAAPPPPPPPPPPAPPAPAFQPAAPAYPALPQPWPQQAPQGWPQQALPQPWPQQPQGWPQAPQQPQAWPQQPAAQPSPALPGGWQLPSNWPGSQAQQPAVAPQQPVAAPAQASAQVGSVTVQRGDTLMKIAKRVYGDEAAWTRLFEANRDQIRNPNLIHAGMVLRVPGGAQGDRPAAPSRPALQAQGLDAAPAAPDSGLGARAVAEARRLMASGYKYPPNLTTRYFHRRFEVGCCADFVVDAWAKAGVDVFKRISNPHYTPTQRKWLQDQGAWAPKNASVKVGDWVFFKWPGTDAVVSHVAMVSEVDAQGRPTKIIESYSGNKPVRERAVGSSAKYIAGFGRLDVIAAKGN